MKLFCFPYAGGLPSIYYAWKRMVSPALLEMVPFEVRTSLHSDGVVLATSFYEVLEDVYRRIIPELGEEPFAFYGHSMGGLIVYELTRKLLQNGKPLPQHLFLSASRVPHAYHKLVKTYDLPHDEFIESLRKLGGTPDEVLDNHEILEVFLPMIRADFQAVQTYEMNHELPQQIPVNMTVLFGKEDSIEIQDIVAWRDYCGRECKFFPMPGGHFFIHQQMNTILVIIQDTLKVEQAVAIRAQF
ncbi:MULTISPECIES: thioesterase domain-containing protein [Bacillales]|uniref:thioesterase II family protein n=1 Tax=Bacillales TaxID=1385 RepID=UPI0003715200|nr:MULTISPECIES: thioesterase domain-containing protein [Bacillales]KMZ40918.1 thioesterase [Bacillus sp. FJAT-27238]